MFRLVATGFVALALALGLVLGLTVNLDPEPWVRHWSRFIARDGASKDPKAPPPVFTNVSATDFDALLSLFGKAVTSFLDVPL